MEEYIFTPDNTSFCHLLLPLCLLQDTASFVLLIHNSYLTAIYFGCPAGPFFADKSVRQLQVPVYFQLNINKERDSRSLTPYTHLLSTFTTLPRIFELFFFFLLLSFYATGFLIFLSVSMCYYILIQRHLFSYMGLKNTFLSYIWYRYPARFRRQDVAEKPMFKFRMLPVIREHCNGENREHNGFP